MRLSAICLAITRPGGAGAGVFNPAVLWPLGASSPGMWIDPPYTASLYQDSVGTTPISAIGTVLDSANPVGLALDRKGGATALADPGIHLLQASATSRPVASARANLLVGTATLSTQNVTVAAIPHTITFSGGGTIVATGTYVGALTSGQTFTPTAGTLTLTVAGTVTSGMLNRGSVGLTYQAVVSDSSYTAAGFPSFVKLDGADDSLASATFAAGTIPGLTDCLIAVRRDSAADMVIGPYQTQDTSPYVGLCLAGSSSSCVAGSGSPTVWVDGVQLAGGTAVTRGTLHTAVTPGAWHIAEFRGLDMAAWTALKVGAAYAGLFFNGAISPIQLFASGQDANRDLSRAQMAAYFGVTLP